MNKTLGKTLLIGGLLIAALVLGKALFYAPNGAVDSGLSAVTTSTATSTIPRVTVPGPLPDKLLIPKLDIEADVQHLGITETGNMAAPNNFTDVSWYELGTIPGQMGSAVMAGHEDNAIALDGVFKHLEDLELGDSVFVVDGDGKKLEFRVVEKAVYPYDNSPTDRIFNAKGKVRLNLITCAGDWLPEAKTNDKRLVVYTELVN